MSNKGVKSEWHASKIADLAFELGTDRVRGISVENAARRLAVYGPNEIRKGEKISPLKMFLAQFASLVIWILIGAAVVAAILGEGLDAAVIIAIVILNATVGFFQEYRAEQAVAALARLTAPRARVVRGGAARVVPASAIVPGDLLLIEAGDLVAADARLVEAAVLRANEAPLTGESEAVSKAAGECDSATALADRKNMLFLGTSVVGGSGRAIVVATGMDTEFGHIAKLLETASSGETPLQRRLDRVARRLLWLCLIIVLLVFGLGLLRSVRPFEMFLSAVSLAVAAIPEGLPAIVTVALALGVSRMATRNALIRRLHSVETLGSAQVICTDKTGTLTVGQMTVRKLIITSEVYDVTGEGYAIEGTIFSGTEPRTAAEDPLLHDLLRASAACNDASISREDGRFSVVGDPTEGALLVAAAKGGLALEDIDRRMPRLFTIPFSSERKLMTVVRNVDGRPRAFVKGAPEVVLQRCSRMRSEGESAELAGPDRARILEANALLANEALRVIACAERPLSPSSNPGLGIELADEIELDLTFLGLIGLQDPPRAEAREAVRKCKRAGIRTVMITGDHPDTACAIARDLEILERGDEVVHGDALEKMADRELAQRVKKISVYARVTAEHKLRIVRAWKSHGAVVAMTGDGVNDAPALKEASIGVAMGITGTEVTKEAADVVIADDNFASIVAAVEEGRGIYDNIVKTLSYLMGGNSGELTVMFLAALIGWPLPLLPTHLLWINLVTDGLPALALATDPIDPDVLSRPPRHPQAEIMTSGFIGWVLLIGCLDAAVTLTAFAYELYAGGSLSSARNAAFFVLVTAELLRSFGARSMTKTIWEIGVLSNMRLCLIVAASFALQLAISQSPFLEPIFNTEPISLAKCLSGVALAMIPALVLQAIKLFRRRAAVALSGKARSAG
jgi:P-type Ca2+ transporter type 2C